MRDAPDVVAPQPTPVVVPTEAVIEAAVVRQKRSWRSVLGILVTVGALGALSAAFLFFPIDYERLGAWGYLGVFAVVFVATASFILPIPYLLIVARAGVFYNPWLVALTAGAAATLGEMTGYLVGISGSALIPHGRWYDKARDWVCTYGFWCIAFFSCVPNPFFDAVGFAAGALRYSVWRFALACLLGKTIKFGIAALIGEQARIHGWLD
jgi:membrane protein YqaA with SNARE-associated domain